MYFRLSVLIIIFTFFINSLAQEIRSYSGSSSALMLRFGSSAKIAALSESFTGLANDENALFYNPAGLVNIKTGSIGLNHTEWSEDIKVDNLIFGYNFKNTYGIAASITHMWMPGIQGYDDLGQKAEEFNVSSSVINLGFGYKIHPSFYTGVGIKYLIENLAGFSASGLAFDFGLYTKTFISGLSTGFVVQNIGGKIQYDKEKQNIPLTYRLGFAYKIFAYDVVISSDIVKSKDADYNFNLGVEYVYLDQFILRIGNRFYQNDLLKLSYGAGFIYQNKYHLNYALFYHSDLGSTHQLGFTFKFNIPATTDWKNKLQIIPKSSALIPPKKIIVKVKSEELIITWEKISDATYNVYARHASQKSWKKLNSEPLKKTQMKFKKPNKKGKYYFRVSSIVDFQESKYSEEKILDVK